MTESTSPCCLVTLLLSIMVVRCVTQVDNAGTNKLHYTNVQIYHMQLFHPTVRDLLVCVLLFIVTVFSYLQEFYCEQYAAPSQRQSHTVCAHHLSWLQ